MDAGHILITTAFFIMLFVVLLLQRKNERLNEKLSEFENSRHFEAKRIKVFRRYKFIVVPNAGEENTLNQAAQLIFNENYVLDREKTTDRLLVFVKYERIN